MRRVDTTDKAKLLSMGTILKKLREFAMTNITSTYQFENTNYVLILTHLQRSKSAFSNYILMYHYSHPNKVDTRDYMLHTYVDIYRKNPDESMFIARYRFYVDDDEDCDAFVHRPDIHRALWQDLSVHFCIRETPSSQDKTRFEICIHEFNVVWEEFLVNRPSLPTSHYELELL